MPKYLDFSRRLPFKKGCYYTEPDFYIITTLDIWMRRVLLEARVILAVSFRVNQALKCLKNPTKTPRASDGSGYLLWYHESTAPTSIFSAITLEDQKKTETILLCYCFLGKVLQSREENRAVWDCITPSRSQIPSTHESNLISQLVCDMFLKMSRWCFPICLF